MTTFYVGALDGSLSIIDLARTRLLREEALDHGIGVLKAAGDGDGGRGRSGLLACGQTNGQVVLRDMVTLRAEHILDAHTAAISDVEAHDNMLVTCGFSARLGNYVVDPVIKVYDIRTMKVVNMLQFPAGPALLKFLPGQAGQLCAASQSGHFTVFDAQTVGAGSPYLYAVDTQGAMLTAVDASSSGGFLAFADSAGLLHPWTIDDPAGATVNAAGASRDIEYPDDVEVDVGVDLMDAGMPLALVPMLYKYTGEPLLSDWPASLAVPARRPPLPLDAHVAATMKMVDFVGYASNPGTRLRNQAEYVPGQGMRRDASESIFTRGMAETCHVTL
jgi:PAB-dependent poly(A)-specific ribonuclease subunit 2